MKMKIFFDFIYHDLKFILDFNASNTFEISSRKPRRENPRNSPRAPFNSENNDKNGYILVSSCISVRLLENPYWNHGSELVSLP